MKVDEYITLTGNTKLGEDTKSKELRKFFDEVVQKSKPKITTLEKYNKYPFFFNDWMSAMRYAKTAFENMPTMHENEDWMEYSRKRVLNKDQTFNDVWLSQKVAYLVEQHRTVGLYAIMQAWTRDDDRPEKCACVLHPGAHRWCANLVMGDSDANILVWDSHNFIDSDVLTFEEYVGLFPEDKDRNFGVLENRSQIECNVQEDRPGMWEFFDEMVEIYKTHDLVIESKTDQEPKDLKLIGILGLSPTTLEYETEHALFKLVPKA